jgi:pyruvate-formate lyase
MSRVVIFEPRSSRDGRTAIRQSSHYNFRHSLTKRLELLRENRARAGSLRASDRHRARAEVYRLQAETFRDPKARAQMLQLAAICDREAIQAEQFEIRQ